MEWSPQQDRALRAVEAWLVRRSPQVFRLYGYAGTGKTTLARHFAEGVSGEVRFAAFTGKAAHVMRQKGCWDATTLHSLIYRPWEKSRERLRTLETRYAKTLADPRRDPATLVRLQADIAAEKTRLKAPAFELNPDSDLREAALLIIDECSMVGEDMGTDILSFGVPVLVLGDPAQLPPVFGAGYFTREAPDVMLTEIHRQAAENPIVAMATAVREGRALDFGTYGESRVLRCSEFDREAIGPEVQVLVGKNETRRRANVRRRKTLGFTSALPSSGDRLVCLRNNHDLGLLNGAIWTVAEAGEAREETIELRVRDEDGRDLFVEAHAAPFRGEEVPIHLGREAEEFDYGYALTVHKAQGSQWADVLIVDESTCFRQDARRWLYTGITRAAERVAVVR
jgi:exodeoxyribonuclease-5